MNFHCLISLFSGTAFVNTLYALMTTDTFSATVRNRARCVFIFVVTGLRGSAQKRKLFSFSFHANWPDSQLGNSGRIGDGILVGFYIIHLLICPELSVCVWCELTPTVNLHWYGQGICYEWQLSNFCALRSIHTRVCMYHKSCSIGYIVYFIAVDLSSGTAMQLLSTRNRSCKVVLAKY